jgi:hypothetical protein
MRGGKIGLFAYMYLIGLLIGLVFYSLTYLFIKERENKKRVLVVFIMGVLFFLGSLIVIGGFEGMPYGVLSAGILTVSIMLALFGNNLLWKKLVYTVIILFVVLYILFVNLNKVDYWIVKKTHYTSDADVGSYIQQLQKDTTIQGYKTFTISEGNKGIVLSLGGKMAGNNIEVLDIKEYGKTTVIKIRTFYNQSSEQNPVVMIGLDRLQPEIIIMDTNGTMYEKATKVD